MLPIERIVIRQTPGNAIDPVALTEAVWATQNGVPLAPVKVVAQGERYVITDGRHRFLAAVIAGRSDLLCEVTR